MNGIDGKSAGKACSDAGTGAGDQNGFSGKLAL
jgi:hypothetical protein